MGLGRFLRGVVALVRRKGPRVDHGYRCDLCDGLAPDMFVGDVSTGDVFEFRSDQPVIQRPAAPRPPTPKEMAEGKRP